MANLNDLSQFLKKDDRKDGDLWTFLDAGEICDVDFSPAKDGSRIQKVFQIKIALPDGREKISTLNKTSINSVKAIWGNDTSAWVGKQVKVIMLKGMAFGKPADIMNLEPQVEA